MAAFDSGNLPAVAKALLEKHPDKPVVIAGDDDQYQRQTQGTNPGRTQAEATAKAVGGKAIFPIFPCDGQAAQKRTDFNDLATKSDYGRSSTKRSSGCKHARVSSGKPVSRRRHDGRRRSSIRARAAAPVADEPA